VILYFHGGGYVFGDPDSHRDIAWRLGKESGSKVLVVDYRLAPEHRFPAAVDDAAASYRWLLQQGFAPDRIAVAGDSAGGGLAVALMVTLKNLGIDLPKVAVLMSPWVDLAMTGTSMVDNAKSDVMLSPEAISIFASYYLGDTNPKAPLASPVFADLSGLPPTLVLVGSKEVLLSDSETLVEKINTAGGDARLSVWPKMPHVFPILASVIPEGKKAVLDMADFLRIHLGTTRLD
jgi:monoterpene epsilon-lactone hydrolase